MKRKLLLLTAIATLPCLNAQQPSPAPVRTEYGLVQGVAESGLTVYRGIPFAAPPVGDLRWRPPQPAPKWDGVRQATKFAHDPYQNGGKGNVSEDCLYLNVWTPAKHADDRLPVLVWIYGGGFSGGGTSGPGVNGEHLARKGVVLVSLNYRVGPFGFLAQPELSVESSHQVSGNYGLLDQIAGMQWVRNNIAGFGGNPNRVTIFGESAGGISVSMLCASPLARGLFQGAISESGGSFGPPRRTLSPGENMKLLPDAERAGEAYLRKAGVSSIAELRRLPPDQLPTGLDTGASWPIIDGWVIPDDQYKLYEAGNYNDVPILVGYNSDEGLSFTREKTPEQYIADTRKRFGPFAERLLTAYPPGANSLPKSARDLMRDAAFGWHTWSWARLQVRTGKSKVFFYYFDQHPAHPADSPEADHGMAHGPDVAYVFQTLSHRDPALTSGDFSISDTVSTYWTNFAKRGDPNGPGVPAWPQFTADDGRLMYFKDKAFPGPVPGADGLKVLDAYFSWRRTPEGTAWADATPLPQIVEQNGHHVFLVDGEPFFILGGQTHNSSAWPEMLPQVWATIEGMHANTLEIPIYWQQIEPQEGAFDFSVLDAIVSQARAHDARVVLLWFATWKNGNTDYTPDWVKLNPRKYPLMVDRDGKVVVSASPNAKTTMEADAKAFVTVLGHLKEFDPQHTVILVQVENEPGTYGTPRDFSATADKLFHAPVPAALLKPEVLQALHRPAKAKGTWSEVFGGDADEFFHAWSVATYINYVAAAGKAVNPLPMYVNVALEGESGGAMREVIPIYKAAAPSIDVLAPDIYQPPVKAMQTMKEYDRPNNPLFVPETFASADYLYEVIRRGGIGFSPFGVDRGKPSPKPNAGAGPELSPLATQYALLRLADGVLPKWIFESRVHGAAVSEQVPRQEVNLDGWQVTISFGAGSRWGPPPPAPKAETKPETALPFGAAPKPTGRAVIVQLGENEFVVMATQCRVAFQPSGTNQGKAWQLLKAEEGHYEGGAFKPLRLRNGDEVGWATLTFGADPALLRMSFTVW